jgi:iron complex outermembrane recepter protein
MANRKAAGGGILAFSSSILALALAAPAAAQDPVVVDDEIIVTAQKREQNIQEVPLAVTALSATQLEAGGVADIRALQTLSPSINLNSSQTESGGTTMRIRGVGTTGNNAGLESAVGVFIDGVYVSRPAIALGELLDIQQVEILRGPQGTLFGRNTSAGALTISTRRPVMNTFGAFGNMTFGQIEGGDVGSLLSTQMGVNIPLIEDTLAVRISAAGRAREGLLSSSFDGSEENTRDRYVVRAQALWEPTADLSLRLIADHQEGQDYCCAAVIVRETLFAPAYTSILGAGNTGVNVSGSTAIDDRIASNTGTFEDPGEQTGFTAQADWDLGFGALTYIGGYRDSHAGPNVQESDFVGLNVFSVGGTTAPGPNPNEGNTTYTSHELRLAGEAGRLNWMVGYYYADEEIDQTAELTLGSQFQANTNANIFGALAGVGLTTPLAIFNALTAGPNGLTAGNANAFLLNPSGFLSQGASPTGAFARNLFTQEGETTSFFTHNTLAVTDALDITVGLRYVEETKDGRFQQLAASNPACLGSLAPNAAVPTLNSLIGATGGAGGTSASIRSLNLAFSCFPFSTPANLPGAGTPANPLTPATFNRTFEDDELVYTANASYEFSDNVRGYASVTHGFKSGGFNLDPTAANGGADPRFASEIVDAYELGLKSELFDGRLRANFALFRSDIEDFQVLEFTGTQFVTFNVPNVIAEGAEMELFGRLTDSLSGSLAVTYTDARYPDDCAAGIAPTVVAVTSLCGSSLTNAPEWVSVLGLNYETPIGGDLRFFANGSVRYETERRTSTQSHVVPTSGTTVRTTLAADDIQDANTKVNLRFGLGSMDERWAVELWGTNIFNEQTRNVTFNVPLRGVSSAVARGAFLEEPAIYGVTLRANY